MEADSSHWTIYVAQVLALLNSLGALLFGVFAPKAPGMRWWWRLLGGVGCALVPAGILIAYQHGRIEGGSLRLWIPRVLIGLGAVGLAVLSDWTGWQSRSEWARDSMVGAVYLLSYDAATSEGSVIHTTEGDVAEVPGRWNSAIFLAAYGVALGALFLRHTLSAVMVLGWTGAFVSAHFYAWCIDSMDTPALAEYYSANYILHFYAPTRIAPWAALAALIAFNRPKPDAIKTSTP